MKIYYPLSFRNIKLLVHMLVVRGQEYMSDVQEHQRQHECQPAGAGDPGQP